MNFLNYDFFKKTILEKEKKTLCNVHDFPTSPKCLQSIISENYALSSSYPLNKLYPSIPSISKHLISLLQISFLTKCFLLKIKENN